MTETVFDEMGLQPGLRNVVDLATEEIVRQHGDI